MSDFLSGRAVRPGRAAATPPPAPGFDSGSTSGGGNLLDLGSSPGFDSGSTSGGGNLLDLGSSPGFDSGSGSASPISTSGVGPGRNAALIAHDLGLPTIAQGERRILTVDDPVVHFTRTQSAAGALEFSAVTPTANQLLMGCVFEAADGTESAVLPGLRPQGPDVQSPIFRATPQGVTVNLRAVTGVRRFFLIGLPQTSDRSMPGGTMVIRTYGGSQLEVVLDTSATFGAKALVTGFVVEGRIVLRAEHDPFSGTLQQVAGVYGYDQLTWRDPFTPLF
ncbi:hypothetical protein [Calidifontibacter terrae]